jgi:hypothetical protein
VRYMARIADQLQVIANLATVEAVMAGPDVDPHVLLGGAARHDESFFNRPILDGDPS